ncbi:MAG: hypothetical protein ABIK89_16765 [Planctomycetota bacterium]
MLRCILLVLAVVISPCALHAATLRPAGAERFFVTPGEPAVLRWEVESGTLDGPIQAVVHDYQDRPVATLPAKVTAEGLVELTVELAPGFYEVELPAAEQRFGVMAIAAHEGAKDPFFSIDAAMSWLVHGDEVRESLVKVLERSGVAMSRERLNWAEISPAKGTWDWESPRHYETLRRSYADRGVDVLEMFHGTTRWAGHVEKYPDDLVGTAQAWREIGLRWRSTWDAMEVWNEPDIFFGGNLPADQYVPLVKTFAYVFARERIDVPLVGGVFADYNRKYLDNAARNGLLDSIDVASFHTYGRAPGMETLIENYRSWLAAHGHEAMPLWLTECGRPWKRGPDRPPADQDAESALDITMKAVESRACGIARYFAFVYPFYEERDNNFGMMGRRATPLRSMAAYARLASLLAHKRYLGDLNSDDAALQRARVFGDDREAVAVLYTGRADPEAKLKLDLPVQRIEGIDGRALEAAEDGSVPVPDGLVYVWLDPAKLGGRLQADTAAMRMSSIEPETAQRRQAPSPIVLRYQFDTATVAAMSEGYRVKAQPPGKMPLTVRVFNLSTEPRDLRLALRLRIKDPDSTSFAILPDRRPVSAPAEGFVDVGWEVDLEEAFAASGHVGVEVLATDEAGRNVALLAIDLSGEATMEQVLNRYPGRVRLPINDLSAWTANIVGHGEMTMDATPEEAWRLNAQFGEGDRWVYPFFKLSDDVDVSRFAALVLRARSHQPATVRVFLWEGDQSVGYMSAGSVIPADGEWHTAVVPFRDLVLCGATTPDANHRLDLPLVQRISIGFNTEAGENTLEVSDAYVLAGE